MLYINTRSTADSVTAYRALHNIDIPNGGFYLPYYITALSAEELAAMNAQLPGETVAHILNLFFGTQLTGWDVECAIGRFPFKTEILSQKITTAELWRNPGASMRYLVDSLYRQMSGNPFARLTAKAWPQIAIRIALLFGICSAAQNIPEQGFDIALDAEDFADIIAAAYAKDMGLPVNTVICACANGSAVWDIITRGLLSGNAVQPAYLECFLYKQLGLAHVQDFLAAQKAGKSLQLGDEEVSVLSSGLFAAVVSNNRIEPLIVNMQRTSGYTLDVAAAKAFGGLQDYRAQSGTIRNTLILSKDRPASAKG